MVPVEPERRVTGALRRPHTVDRPDRSCSLDGPLTAEPAQAKCGRVSNDPTDQQPPDLHPDLAPIAFLLGTWRGEGRGQYPTIDPFTYGEELHVAATGRPFLAYTQRTWSLDTAMPMHVEVGYVRTGTPGRVELIVAHPTGIAEIAEGVVEGMRLTFASRSVGLTSTAKAITSITRSLERTGDELTSTLDMAAVGQRCSPHLRSVLGRVDTRPLPQRA